MGLETLLFIFLFVIGVAIAVGVAKARRRMANRVKPPIENDGSPAAPPQPTSRK